MKASRYLVLATAVAGLQFGASEAQAQVTTWFRANFENLNERGSNLYNFANRYPQSTTTWQTVHTTNAGWNGSAAPRVTIHGCDPSSPTCNFSEHQFNAGWVTPPVGGSRALGDSVFVRWRIRFDNGTRFPPDTVNAKFMMFGRTGTTPNSRWIIHLLSAKDNQGCTLGFDSYSHMGWTPPSNIWTRYNQWGLSSDFNSGSVAGRYAGFSSHVNIDWSCAPAVLVTAGDHASPVPKPQNAGAAPVGGWYHLQYQAVTGNDGQADFRIWANNNAQSNPSSEHLNMADGLGVSGWDGEASIVGYWGTNFQGSFSFVIDDFEIGPVFDPNWYPSGGPRPSPPTGVN